jgi:hypothetical protein
VLDPAIEITSNMKCDTWWRILKNLLSSSMLSAPSKVVQSDVAHIE